VVDRLPTLTLGGLFSEALAVGGDVAREVLAPDGVHPLLAAVGRAFAEHRPLTLSPDAVWLTITQGLAQHVRLNAEQSRTRLVDHAGRRRLTVTVPGMPADAQSWAVAVDSFADARAGQIEDAQWFECDFSTSTAVERTAGRVVLLDTYSPYFSLWMVCICGIPTITLTGTVQDWQAIRARVACLPSFGLDTWSRSLIPITDQFVRAASGEVDVTFWRRIYSPADAYGGEVITGWVARLYPYLLSNGKLEHPNPLLDLPIDQPRDLTGPHPRGMGYQGPGIPSTGVPATLSRVVVNVNDQVTGDNRAVALSAGLVAVAQNLDGALGPVAGWHLTPATPNIHDVTDRLTREHSTTPPAPTPAWQLPAEAVALYERIGSAVLFDATSAPWRGLPVADHRITYLGDGYAVSVQGIIELPGDRMLAALARDMQEPTFWVICRMRRGASGRSTWEVDQEPADIQVYGTSLAMIIDAALDAGGDIDHLRTGWLNDLP
jgi:hypothetical protein